MKKRLAFREDGTFTIVQFTDVHWKNGEPEDLQSEALMNAVLEAEKPDLVVFTGDQLRGEFCTDPCSAYIRSVKAVDERGIPWAAVFGNHDDENLATREELLSAQKESAFCLTEKGPEEIAGIGNYILTVDGQDNRAKAVLYFLDSGAYAPERVGGYAYIHRSQIDWYARESSRFTLENDGPLPALAFFHIPLPEYKDVWDFTECFGDKFEGVGSPFINTGLLAAMVEAGDVMATFVGHDHINDYWGMQHGIRLCYGRATGYNTYGRDGFPRGARIIRLREGIREFESWIRLDDGTVIQQQQRHEPLGRSADEKPVLPPA